MVQRVSVISGIRNNAQLYNSMLITLNSIKKTITLHVIYIKEILNPKKINIFLAVLFFFLNMIFKLTADWITGKVSFYNSIFVFNFKTSLRYYFIAYILLISNYLILSVILRLYTDKKYYGYYLVLLQTLGIWGIPVYIIRFEKILTHILMVVFFTIYTFVLQANLYSEVYVPINQRENVIMYLVCVISAITTYCVFYCFF
ncbi:hypothetical protein NUSPORA_01910 [Nucleospora cyclopteri]